jgi:acyl-CoA synthetase (AMP-forming)/AMP-acid ligase II
MTSSLDSTALKARPATRVAFGPGLDVHPSRREPHVNGPAGIPAVSSVGAALAHFAAVAPSMPAAHFIDFEDQVLSVTRGELLAHAQRSAASLASRGVGRGDAVILCFDTGLSLVSTFLGCSLIGAVPVLTEMPIGFARTRVWTDLVARMARLANARALVVDEGFRSPAQEVADACALPLLSQSDFIHDAPVPPLAELGPDDLAFIQFSSGTTGAPKGVTVTQGALFANVRAMGERARFTDDETTVGWLPLYHDMGLIGLMLTPLLQGFPFALMSPLAFLFRPERWLWAIHHFRGTLTTAPNFAYQLCAKRIAAASTEGLDLSSLRLAFNGAELVQRETLTAFHRRFAPNGLRTSAMYPVYGMAEAGLGVAFPEPGHELHVDCIDRDALALSGRAEPSAEGLDTTAAFVSVGRMLPGYEVRIVGEDGTVHGDRQQGQIVMRGPSFTGVYVNAPEDTAAAFRDGWFWSGDLGYTVGGALFVCGRAKDLIIKAGRNYHPHAFETSAARVQGVRVGCVAALGVRNEATGTEDVVVVLETRLEDPAEVAALKSTVETQIFRDVGLRPERIVAVAPQSLAKTSSGKVSRAAVLKRLLDGSHAEVGLPRA